MPERSGFKGSKQMFGPSLFSYDTYCFLSDDYERSRLDVYVAFANDILQFVKEKQGYFVASYDLSVSVFDKKGNLIDEKSVPKNIVVRKFERTNNTYLSNHHKFSFDIIPGKYKLVLNLTDNDTQKNLVREKKLDVDGFGLENALISEILFSNQIITNSNATIKEIIPNLDRKFSDPDSSFWAYFEMYPKTQSDSITLHLSIIDANNHTITPNIQSFNPNGRIIAYLVDLGKYVKISGRYIIIIRIDQNGRKALKRAKFIVNWHDSQFSKIDIDVSIKTLKDYLPSKDYKFLLQSSDSVKKEYFQEFWDKRDPTPNTKNNELLDEFYKRIDFANNYFSINTLDKEGWQTDRGDIYIKYGPPSEVRRHLDEINLPPSEIWYYEKERRRFIFEDRSGMGDFRLVRME